MKHNMSSSLINVSKKQKTKMWVFEVTINQKQTEGFFSIMTFHKFKPSIHQMWGEGAISSPLWVRGRSPIHQRASQRRTEKTTLHTYTLLRPIEREQLSKLSCLLTYFWNRNSWRKPTHAQVENIQNLCIYLMHENRAKTPCAYILQSFAFLWRKHVFIHLHCGL